jgi:hypothetical protein
MKSFARIRAGGGTILLPARNPYDHEVLLEHLEHGLHVQPELHLELCGHPFAVRSRGIGSHCDLCHELLERLLLTTPQQTLCFACALREAAIEPARRLAHTA